MARKLLVIGYLRECRETDPLSRPAEDAVMRVVRLLVQLWLALLGLILLTWALASVICRPALLQTILALALLILVLPIVFVVVQIIATNDSRPIFELIARGVSLYWRVVFMVIRLIWQSSGSIAEWICIALPFQRIDPKHWHLRVEPYDPSASAKGGAWKTVIAQGTPAMWPGGLDLAEFEVRESRHGSLLQAIRPYTWDSAASRWHHTGEVLRPMRPPRYWNVAYLALALAPALVLATPAGSGWGARWIDTTMSCRAPRQQIEAPATSSAATAPITFATAAPPTGAAAAPATATLDQDANLREGPGVENQVVAKLRRGAQVEALGEERQAPDGSFWVWVRANGVEGWVNRRLLRDVP